jgi:hypothetical protein
MLRAPPVGRAILPHSRTKLGNLSWVLTHCGRSQLERYVCLKRERTFVQPFDAAMKNRQLSVESKLVGRPR